MMDAKVVWRIRAGLVATLVLIVACAGREFRMPKNLNVIANTEGCGLLAVGEDALWTLCKRGEYDNDGFSVVKIDPDDGTVVARGGWFAGVTRPTSLVEGQGAIWVGFEVPGIIFKIDRETLLVVDKIPLASEGEGKRLAVSPGALWTTGPESLVRVNAERPVEISVIPLPETPYDLFYDEGSLWGLLPKANFIIQVDAHTNRVVSTLPIRLPQSRQIPMQWPHRGRWIAKASGDIWFVLGNRGFLEGGAEPTMMGRLDLKTNQVVASIDLGGVFDITASGDKIVGLSYDSIVEIDRETNLPRKLVSFGWLGYPGSVALGSRAVWLARPGHGIYRIPLDPDRAAGNPVIGGR